MMDCLLANTSARNPEIGGTPPISQALCNARNDLIHATQSQHLKCGKDAAGGIVEVTAGITDAAGAKNTQCGNQRFRPLCNECAFTIGHGHVVHIVTHKIMGGRTESTLREVSP
jgi:hypothetical protein